MKSWFKSSLWAALVFTVLFTGFMAKKASVLDSPDFKVFYTAGRHALHSPELLYKVSPDRFLYPPEASIFFIPFAFSGHWALHHWVWHIFLGSVLFLLASGSWAAFGSALLLTRYLSVNFGYGQINLVVLALMIAVSTLLQRRKVSAGAVWAVACLTKVFPLVQGMEFLVRRAWRELALAVAVVCGIAALTVGFWGWDTALELHREFFMAIGSKGLPLHSHNQSIAALLLRLTTNEVFELHTVAYVHWGLVLLPVWLVKLVAFGIGAALTFFSWRRAVRRGLPWDNCAAALFSVVFLSHIVWKDYFLFLFVPLFQILELKPRYWKFLIAAFLALITFSSRDIVGPYGSAFLDAAGIHLWAGIIVWWGWLRLEKTNS